MTNAMTNAMTNESIMLRANLYPRVVGGVSNGG